jgi:hypothetical protein
VSDILTDVQRYAALFDDSPRATRLECGNLLPEVLRSIAVPAERQPWQPPDLSAVPIIVKDDMPPLAWRMLDQHGQTMSDGNLAA